MQMEFGLRGLGQTPETHIWLIRKNENMICGAHLRTLSGFWTAIIGGGCTGDACAIESPSGVEFKCPCFMLRSFPLVLL